MSDRRRFLKGLTSPRGRRRPIRRPTTLRRHIALRQPEIGHERTPGRVRWNLADEIPSGQNDNLPARFVFFHTPMGLDDLIE